MESMKQGFFTIKETTSKTRPNGKSYSCASCGLYQFVLSPRMEPFGKFQKRILNIGEAPGEMEDRKDRQWQGKVGQRLKMTYTKLGIDLFEDCLNINSINCRPTDKHGNNREPTPNEIACCRQKVLQVIQQYQPKVIILLGGSALQSIIGYRWRKNFGTISKWRGWTIPDRDFNAWICPTYHPSYIERAEGIEVNTVWEQDLKRAFNMIEQSLPVILDNEESHVEIIDDLEKMEIPKHGTIAIDYETTGLKPYATGHRIVCASIAVSEEHSYAFMMPGSKSGRERFIDILADKRIGKVAHNMKFEETWSTIRLKQSVKNWVWDTMLAAHVMDNRADISGLKFQTYVNFGVVDYSSSISSYLRSTQDNNANTMNKVLELVKSSKGKKELLTYCGMDSLFTYQLMKKQIGRIKL